MSVILFANGNAPAQEIKIDPGSTIIAADGGARHCLKLGIPPQIVIGDFDSLSEVEIKELEKIGAVLLRFPEDKDETDLELALDNILEAGETRVKCYGLLGGRWDMSIANILLLGSSRYKNIHFRIIDEGVEMFVLRGGDTLDLSGTPGEVVSVIPLTSNVSGITYQGLNWPLDNATLLFGSPRGVSNQFLADSAKITLESGLVLVVHNIDPSGNKK